MVKKNIVDSYFLVGIQFSAIIFLLVIIPSFKWNVWGIVFLLLSGLLLLWAVFSMRQSKLRVMPEPDSAAHLIVSGPYQYIRHPMYTSVLLYAIGMLCFSFTWWRLMIMIILFLVLQMKIHKEEKYWKVKDANYKNYVLNTKRMFPFLW